MVFDPYQQREAKDLVAVLHARVHFRRHCKTFETQVGATGPEAVREGTYDG